MGDGVQKYAWLIFFALGVGALLAAPIMLLVNLMSMTGVHSLAFLGIGLLVALMAWRG